MADQLGEIQAIETSKTSDAIFIEFGFNLQHLNKAIVQLKLTENEELQKFQKLVIAQKESEQRALLAKAQPPEELIQEMCAEVESSNLGKP